MSRITTWIHTTANDDHGQEEERGEEMRTTIMKIMTMPMIIAAGPSSYSGRAIWSQMGHTLGVTTMSYHLFPLNNT